MSDVSICPSDDDPLWGPVTAKLVQIEDVEVGDRYYANNQWWSRSKAKSVFVSDALVWTKRRKNCVLYYQNVIPPTEFHDAWRDVPAVFCDAIIGAGERHFTAFGWRVSEATSETKILGWAKRAPAHYDFNIVNGWKLERAPSSTVREGDLYHAGQGWFLRSSSIGLAGYAWIYRMPKKEITAPPKTVDPAVLPGMVSLLELCKRELAKGTDPRDVLGGFEGQRAVTLRPGVSVTEEYFQSVVKAERDRRLHVEQFDCTHGRHAARGCPVCSAFKDQMEKRSDAWIPK